MITMSNIIICQFFVDFQGFPQICVIRFFAPLRMTGMLILVSIIVPFLVSIPVILNIVKNPALAEVKKYRWQNRAQRYAIVCDHFTK